MSNGYQIIEVVGLSMMRVLLALILISSVVLTIQLSYKNGDSDLAYSTSVNHSIGIQNLLHGAKGVEAGKNQIYSIANEKHDSNRTYKIGFVKPVFTFGAYNDSSFYNFYHKYKDTKSNINITTDLALLRNNKIPTAPFIVYNSGSTPSIPYSMYFSTLKEHVERIVPRAIVTDITDIDAHFGRIFDSQNHRNAYDILFLFHNEYLTQEEYDNLKLFVVNGGTIVFTEANALYAQINYNPDKNSITLVKGHNWEFDGKVARKSVAERWPEETREWTGSNFMYGKPTSLNLDFLNLPFNYTHSEEQHVTNKNAKILHNYGVRDPKDNGFNATVATYEMHHGKGKVIGIGLYGHTLVGQQGFKSFLKLIDYIVIPHSLHAKDYRLVDEKEIISIPSIMRTGEVSSIELNKQLKVLTINLKRSLLQQDNLTISMPRNIINPYPHHYGVDGTESYVIMAGHQKLDFDYITLDSVTGFKISLPYNATTVQIFYTLPPFSITAPKDINVEAQEENNTLEQLGQATTKCDSQDNGICDGLIISNNAPSSFPIGSTYVTWVALHPHSGVSVKDLQKITIYDDIRPDLTITDPAIDSALVNNSNGILNIGGTAYDKSGIEKVEAFAYDLPFGGEFSYKTATPVAPGDWSSWSLPLDVGNSAEIGVTVRATDKAGNKKWEKSIYSLNLVS